MFCLPKTAWPPTLTIGEVLWNGKMECSSCHDVHNTKNSGSKFTWTEDTNSALCLTCQSRIVAMSFCEPRSW